jgi:hypothetical protein
MRNHLLLLAAIGAVSAATPGPAQPTRASQDRLEAFRGVREGNLLPLNVIRDRVAARFPDARMIGADLIGAIYRVRLMRGRDVMLVDVDGRSGQLLRCIGRC